MTLLKAANEWLIEYGNEDVYYAHELTDQFFESMRVIPLEADWDTVFESFYHLDGDNHA